MHKPDVQLSQFTAPAYGCTLLKCEHTLPVQTVHILAVLSAFCSPTRAIHTESRHRSQWVAIYMQTLM